jgi:hypothetical protein
MEDVARLPAEERSALFTETAARMGLVPLLVEKDFWVCWQLSRLYALRGIPRLLFKGGTSLSKAFAAIQRFSEDIDIGLERDGLGLDDREIPNATKSRKWNQSAVKALRARVKAYVRDELTPRLRNDAAAMGIDGMEFVCEDSGQDADVWVRYPRALDAANYPPDDDGYNRPEVKLEIGARSDHYPTHEVEIRPYAAMEFPGAFRSPSCRIVAQAPERTLLEKALIIHGAVCKSGFAKRLSRHAYDLAVLSKDESILAKADLVLFRTVAEQKKVFGDDFSGDEALRDGIRLVPGDDTRKSLSDDYAKMTDMIFGEPPPLGEILASLAALEARLRALTH